ncbi:hypothetical protein [Kitasatospora sp. NPDC058190]|uniref:hypothetical protein n=1 Tax=Kitasatospora sp. NPDC058190 TaxID=3346371 RepID=UPI0036DAA1A7
MVGPTRALLEWHRGQRYFPGWYWAATTASLVGFESWLERERLMLLDHDRRAVGLASQPFPAPAGPTRGGWWSGAARG